MTLYYHIKVSEEKYRAVTLAHASEHSQRKLA